MSVLQVKDLCYTYSEGLPGEKRAVKVGSKIVQVKGVMPLTGGLTRETPTGRAVGSIGGWHNFF